MRRSIFRLALAAGLLAAGWTFAQTNITFWHIFDSGDALEFIDEVVSDFNAANPDIHVEHLGTNFWDYWTRLTTAMAAGTGPDVALNDLGNVASRAAAGIILDITDEMAATGATLAPYWAATHPMLQYQDGIYALPFETDVRALYYNKDHFEAAGLDGPPTNWAELSEYADLLTVKAANGRLERVGFNPSIGNLGFYTLAWLNGAEFLDDEGNLVLNSPETIEALEFMVDLVNRYGQREMSAFTATFGSGATDPFLAGQVSMIAQNNTFGAQIRRFAPDVNFGVAPLPNNDSPASWSNGFSIEIAASTDNPDAAWRFMEYVMSAEVQAEYAKRNGSMVGNQAAATDPELMTDEVWAVMVDQMAVSRFRPFVMEAPTWYDTSLQPEVDAALLGRKSAQQALDDAQAALEAEIARFRQTQ